MDATFLIAVALDVLLTVTAIVLAIHAAALHDRWKTEKARRKQDADRLTKARSERSDALVMLADSQRRERMAVNQLADQNNIERPFPDVAPAAGSLEEGLTDLRWTDEVERHANTSEQ